MRDWNITIMNSHSHFGRIQEGLDNAFNKGIMQMKHFKIKLNVYPKKWYRDVDGYEYADLERLLKAFGNHIFALQMDLDGHWSCNWREFSLPRLEHLTINKNIYPVDSMKYEEFRMLCNGIYLIENHRSTLKSLTLDGGSDEPLLPMGGITSAPHLETLKIYQLSNRHEEKPAIGHKALFLLNYSRNITKLSISCVNLSDLPAECLTFPKLKHLELGSYKSFGIIEQNKERLESLVILRGLHREEANFPFPTRLPKLKTLVFRNCLPWVTRDVLGRLVSAKISLDNVIIYDVMVSCGGDICVPDGGVLNLKRFIFTDPYKDLCLAMLSENASTVECIMTYLNRIESDVEEVAGLLSGLPKLKQLIISHSEEDSNRYDYDYYPRGGGLV